MQYSDIINKIILNNNNNFNRYNTAPEIYNLINLFFIFIFNL